MPDVLQTLIPYVVVGMLLVAGVLFVFALWNFRRGKREPYWRLRRAASLHGWELFLVSVTLTFLASGVCLFSGLAQAVLGGSTPEALATGEVLIVTATTSVEPISSPEGLESTASASSPSSQTPASATDTARPTLLTGDGTPATIPPTSQPAGTPTTATPDATLSDTALPDVDVTPLESNVTPPADATLTITAVDSQTTGDLQPVAPGDVLPAGSRRVYFWLSYSGMVDGAAWQRILLRDGIAIQGGSYLWASGADGSTVYFFGDAEGFTPGNYEIRVELGAAEVASYAFRIE